MDWNKCFDIASNLYEKGMYHAALERWNELLGKPCDDQCKSARLHDKIGYVYFQIADFEHAYERFQTAASRSQDPDSEALYTIHMAIANWHLAESDKAQRILSRAASRYAKSSKVSLKQKALLYENLSGFQGSNEHLKDGIASGLKAMAAFEAAGEEVYTPYKATAYNNLGFLYLCDGSLDEAEKCLKKARELDEDFLSPVLELSYLFIKKRDWKKSVEYGKLALEKVWSSIINFEKDDVARLCQIIAELAHNLGEQDIALRLIEKSGLYFGQLGKWTEWQEVQNIFEKWSGADEEEVDEGVYTLSYEQIGQFLSLLDAMNAQELLHPKVSILLDMRVHYVKKIAEALGKSKEETEILVYASRFADYGMTALESEVIENPNRSKQALAQYEKHSALGAQMVQALHIPQQVSKIVADHHECFDGSGYPIGKSGEGIDPLARIFSVADAYSFGVTYLEKTHSEALDYIISRRGTKFDPSVVDAFKSMFELEQVEVA